MVNDLLGREVSINTPPPLRAALPDILTGLRNHLDAMITPAGVVGISWKCRELLCFFV